jgi:hypothetical protein
MEEANKQELKTPFQALKLLKSDLKDHPGFKTLTKMGFIDKKKFFDAAYDLIKDNFQQTGKIFVLQEQVDILIMNEIQANVSSTVSQLLQNDLLDITGVNPNGEILYKLSEKGKTVAQYLQNLNGEEESN